MQCFIETKNRKQNHKFLTETLLLYVQSTIITSFIFFADDIGEVTWLMCGGVAPSCDKRSPSAINKLQINNNNTSYGEWPRILLIYGSGGEQSVKRVNALEMAWIGDKY